MTPITISLTDEQAERLECLARQAGVAASEIASAGLQDWLSRPREDFAVAAKYVLEKNKELYRRLA
ncbi:MAG: DNA-binding protein [Planctomycetota bacterium]|nr:DNA-binding protein [Planctomycetaceae bacterium]MDQ3330602.1 DNA-binding protein [Planctomycetota bacterium]